MTDEAQRRAAVVPEGERDALQRTAQATSLALLTASVSAIQKQLASRDEQGVRRVGLSTQWLIAIFGAIFAAFVAAAGMLVTIALALIALYASGKI